MKRKRSSIRRASSKRRAARKSPPIEPPPDLRAGEGRTQPGILSAAGGTMGALLASEPARTILKELKQWWRPGASTKTDAFGMEPDLLDWLRPFFEFLYHVYFRVEASGAENVPIDGPAILVANHAGAIPYDGPMIHLAVYNGHPARRGVRFLVDDFVYNVPMLAEFIRRAGGVRASPENAAELIDAGHLIVVFPEGVRGVGKSYDERYRLQRFGRGGFVRLAIRTGAPIVPVAVVGSEEIHPIIWKSHFFGRRLGIPFIPFTPTFPWLGPLGIIPLPSKWRIAFGRPISFERFKPTDAEDDDLVFSHAEDIREKIQRMIDAMLARRKSIWM